MVKRPHGWDKAGDKLRQIALASGILGTLAVVAAVLMAPRDGSGIKSWARWGPAAAEAKGSALGGFGNLLDLLPDDGGYTPSSAVLGQEIWNFRRPIPFKVASPSVENVFSTLQEVLHVDDTTSTTDPPPIEPPVDDDPLPDPDPDPDPTPSPSPSPTPSPTPSPSPTPPDEGLLPITPPPLEPLIEEIGHLTEDVAAELAANFDEGLNVIQEAVEQGPDLWMIVPDEAESALHEIIPIEIWNALVSVEELARVAIGSTVDWLVDVLGPDGDVEHLAQETTEALGQAGVTATAVAETVESTAEVLAEEVNQTVEQQVAETTKEVNRTVESATAAAQPVTGPVTNVVEEVTETADGAVDLVTQTIEEPPAVENLEVVSYLPISPNNPFGQGVEVLKDHNYTFRVRGTYNWSTQYSLTTGQDLEADASCAIPLLPTGAAGERFVHTPFAEAPTALDLQVNGASVNWKPTGRLLEPEADGSQLCSADHSYEWSYGVAPIRKTLTFVVNDLAGMNDNVGMLVLEVRDSYLSSVVTQQGLTDGFGMMLLFVLMLTGLCARRTARSVDRQRTVEMK